MVPRTRIPAAARTARSIRRGLLGGFLTGTFAGAAVAQGCGGAGGPCVGPARGVVILAGGGQLDPSIYRRFVELAGGADARIVLIPTAGSENGSHDGWTAAEGLLAAGARHLEILHTRNRSVADLEAFASPLEVATGVWISGGRQWRLVDVYLDTETHQELAKVLSRGGVIGGNSAGASALASFLLRGGDGNSEIIAEERSQGFGFLRNTAVDQHLMERGRENEMFEVLRREPQLLGLGLNEGSAVVVAGDLAHVLGERVAVYDVTDPLTLIPLRWLDPGEIYDLGARRMVLPEYGAPPGVAPPMDGPDGGAGG